MEIKGLLERKNFYQERAFWIAFVISFIIFFISGVLFLVIPYSEYSNSFASYVIESSFLVLFASIALSFLFAYSIKNSFKKVIILFLKLYLISVLIITIESMFKHGIKAIYSGGDFIFVGVGGTFLIELIAMFVLYFLALIIRKIFRIELKTIASNTTGDKIREKFLPLEKNKKTIFNSSIYFLVLIILTSLFFNLMHLSWINLLLAILILFAILSTIFFSYYKLTIFTSLVTIIIGLPIIVWSFIFENVDGIPFFVMLDIAVRFLLIEAIASVGILIRSIFRIKNKLIGWIIALVPIITLIILILFKL